MPKPTVTSETTTNFYENDFNVPNLFDSSSDNEEEFDRKFQKTKDYDSFRRLSKIRIKQLKLRSRDERLSEYERKKWHNAALLLKKKLTERSHEERELKAKRINKEEL